MILVRNIGRDHFIEYGTSEGNEACGYADANGLTVAWENEIVIRPGVMRAPITRRDVGQTEEGARTHHEEARQPSCQREPKYDMWSLDTDSNGARLVANAIYSLANEVARMADAFEANTAVRAGGVK